MVHSLLTAGGQPHLVIRGPEAMDGLAGRGACWPSGNGLGAGTVDLSVSVALVTGANQGIGLGFVEVLLARGIAKVYATARNPATLDGLVGLDPDRVVGLALDVTSAEQRLRAAEQAPDVDLLINNAGIPGSEQGDERRFLAATNLDDARQVMETDLWAPAEMCRLFVPPMVRRGRGQVINIVSIGALFCTPEYATYSAAKAAFGMMTQGLRIELNGSGVGVAGVFTGGVETRMSANNPNSLVSPQAHAEEVLDAVAAGEADIFAGARAGDLRDAVRSDPMAFEAQLTERFNTNRLE
jgi:short-subunit dehydrogenase